MYSQALAFIKCEQTVPDHIYSVSKGIPRPTDG